MLYVGNECIGILLGVVRKRADALLEFGIGPGITCESCELVECVGILAL